MNSKLRRCFGDAGGLQRSGAEDPQHADVPHGKNPQASSSSSASMQHIRENKCMMVLHSPLY